MEPQRRQEIIKFNDGVTALPQLRVNGVFVGGGDAVQARLARASRVGSAALRMHPLLQRAHGVWPHKSGECVHLCCATTAARCAMLVRLPVAHRRMLQDAGMRKLKPCFDLFLAFCGASVWLSGVRRCVGWAGVQEMEDFGELDDVLQGGPVPQLNANQ